MRNILSRVLQKKIKSVLFNISLTKKMVASYSRMKNYKYLSEIFFLHMSTLSFPLLRLLIIADAPVQSNTVDVTKLRRALLEQLHSTSTNYSCLYCHCFLEFQTIAIVSISA